MFGSNGVREYAVFIGTDHSMGLRTGTKYEVTTTISKGKIVLWAPSQNFCCPYDTVCALFKNWKFLGR